MVCQIPRVEKSMSLPSVDTVRQRLETIEDIQVKRCLQTTYLLCSRIGEVISKAYASDRTARPTGVHLRVRKEIYKPDLTNPEEFQTLMLTRIMQNQPSTLGDLANISEPVAVFTIMLEKRKGSFKRETGLPLNYDPLVPEVTGYIEERQKETEAIFPFYRQQLYTVAKQLFDGFTYKIVPYSFGPKGARKVRHEHLKDFANHALRHLRASELRNFYGIKESDLDAFVGWVPSRGERSTTQDRYAEAPWRTYFPKLLKRR